MEDCFLYRLLRGVTGNAVQHSGLWTRILARSSYLLILLGYDGLQMS